MRALDTAIINAFQWVYDLLWDAFGLRLGTFVFCLGMCVQIVFGTIGFAMPITGWTVFGVALCTNIIAGVLILSISRRIFDMIALNEQQRNGFHAASNRRALIERSRNSGLRIVLWFLSLLALRVTVLTSMIVVEVVFYGACILLRDRDRERFAAPSALPNTA